MLLISRDLPISTWDVLEQSDCVSSHVLTSIVHAFVCSRTDYCNSLLVGLPKVRLSHIQSVLNAATARLIARLPRTSHISAFMFDGLTIFIGYHSLFGYNSRFSHWFTARILINVFKDLNWFDVNILFSWKMFRFLWRFRFLFAFLLHSHLILQTMSSWNLHYQLINSFIPSLACTHGQKHGQKHVHKHAQSDISSAWKLIGRQLLILETNRTPTPHLGNQ